MSLLLIIGKENLNRQSLMMTKITTLVVLTKMTSHREIKAFSSLASEMIQRCWTTKPREASSQGKISLLGEEVSQ